MVFSGTAAETPFMPVYESRADLAPRGKIDEIVFGKLKQLGIQPANLCSDGVFVRRVYLDAIGTLPTAQEALQFLKDQDPNKRSVLIDRLLEREEFADYLTMKWSDLLRVKAEFPINLWPNAAQEYHHWIRSSIRENKPYDRFVRELLMESGSNFRVGPVNFYRAMQNKEPQAIAQTVALNFMGVRAEKWPKERLVGMAGFFSQIAYKETGEWKEEIVFYDPGKPQPPVQVFPDGTAARLSPDRDPREAFADWLITPKNPWFTRNIANRVWSWLLGRGVVQEPDDIRPDNPPSNPELLAYLEQELIASHYDIKALYKSILNSKTYQLSSIPRTDRPEAEANFASYPLRRLEAEVLVDALCQITGTTEKYTSAIPEPFTVIPDGERSVRLPDGSITSSFLELFGRPSRDTGLESERNNKTSSAQRLHMLNSSHVQRKIEQSQKIQGALRGAKTPQAAAATLYLMILSRWPTPEELKVVESYSVPGKTAKGREGLDLAWALINSSEFLYRH
jgi:hypothetical protein